MATQQLDFNELSLRDALDLAVLIEEEARARYVEFAEQMEQHGRALAGSHVLETVPAKDRLLARLDANERVLVNVCALLTEAVASKQRITPAGEWLLDNFHLIEEQIRTAKRHLPRGYSRKLPRLARGPSAGHPRVYDIALEIVSHGDGRVDTEGLSRFVAAYQTVTTLDLGELWAIPIMLRLAVIENGFDVLQSSPRVEEVRLIAEKNRDAAPGVPREDLLIYLGTVVGIDNEPLDPGLPEVVHGVGNDRTTLHGQEGFGAVTSQRHQARPQTRPENKGRFY